MDVETVGVTGEWIRHCPHHVAFLNVAPGHRTAACQSGPPRSRYCRPGWPPNPSVRRGPTAPAAPRHPGRRGRWDPTRATRPVAPAVS